MQGFVPCVDQPKWHYLVIVMASRGGEGSLVNAQGVLEIEFSEDGCILKFKSSSH